MKTKMFFKISIIVSLTICLSSCYAIKHRRWTPINNKQKALIKKIHRTTDTVYLFSSILDDAYIWYHDRGYIHLYHFNKNEIHFNREIYIEAENLNVDTSDFNKVFKNDISVPDAFQEKGFFLSLDGEGIKAYVKGVDSYYYSSVNIDIVMNTEYENTCCKKIKYDLMKILGSYKKDH